ncbi:MAG TPA: hypothetical protein VFN31_03090 [Candidatus Saccharimonadales bacterium]|nr:hypothetical protein [Candidatus Saccharimonadales bacterium]
MNSLENPLSSNSSISSEDNPEDKKNTDEKKKSKSLSFRLLGEEAKNKPDTKDEPLFKFLEVDTDKQKEKEETVSEEVVADHEADDALPPLESLTADEEQQAAAMLRREAREHRIDQPAETFDDDRVSNAVEDYDAKIIDEGLEPDEAFEQVLEEYGIDPSSIEQTNELEPNEATEADDLQEIDLKSLNEEGELPLQENLHHEDEPRLDEDRKEAEDPIQPIADAGGSGGGRKPPVAPGPSGNTPPPNPYRSSRFNSSVMPASGNLSTPTYNTIRRDHHDYWSGFMTGGVVGYFVGHRRGRIKTEKKLNKVKNKLEKQVKQIDNKLARQEYTIRRLVKNQSEIGNKKEASLKIERQPKPATEIKQTTIKEILASAPAAEMHIGKLVMSERPLREEVIRPSSTNKERVPQKPISSNREKPVSVDTMNRQELLKASEDIVIDGSSLRQIYETQLVGEKGLRRLVDEHLKGGDLKKALNNEILERQIDFERDPAMRDTASPSHSAASVADQQSLESMIKKAEAALSNTQEEVAFLKAKAAHEGKQYHQHARALNAIFISIIAFLIVTIILLSFLKYG